jgi:mannose-binding lectin 1
MLDDVFAASLQSQQDQFADLHYRIQIMNHQVNNIYDLLDKLAKDSDDRYNTMMGRLIPMHDQVSAVMRNVEKVERTTMETLRDLESKDFKALLNQVHDSIERSHSALGTSMPLAMAGSKSFSLDIRPSEANSRVVVGKERPSMTTFLFIAVAVQIMIFGAWQVYKKRRNSGPKKFL